MKMIAPDRRTVIVLASLVGAMTVASGLLLLLEPRKTGSITGVSLLSVDHSGAGTENHLFHTAPQAKPGRWFAIVVTCKPRSAVQSAAYRPGRVDDSPYHFLIPSGDSDAPIEVGQRWRQQEQGAYWQGPESQWVNRHAIGVCLENDVENQAPSEDQLRRLIWLVQHLQSRYQIPADRVVLQVDLTRSASGVRWFPTAWFRQQLLAFAIP